MRMGGKGLSRVDLSREDVMPPGSEGCLEERSIMEGDAGCTKQAY